MTVTEKQIQSVKQIVKNGYVNTNDYKVFINKLNKFHKHNILDIIQVYADDYKNKGSLDLANLKIILFDEYDMKFNYIRGVKDDVDIVIRTPYDFITSENIDKIKNVQDYFEQLSISSAIKMNRSHKQVKTIIYPTINLQSIILFTLIQLPIIVLALLTASSTLSNKLASLLHIKVQYIFIGLYALIGLTLIIHIIEIISLKIFAKWSHHRVPTDLKIEHFIFAMLEGFPHHQRFDSSVKKVQDSGFYDLDIDEVDNII
ncbi:hypothetical protein ACO0SA_000403 [Hanseniaspora valbyensis]